MPMNGTEKLVHVQEDFTQSFKSLILTNQNPFLTAEAA
jgi:hypothetical protein